MTKQNTFENCHVSSQIHFGPTKIWTKLHVYFSFFRVIKEHDCNIFSNMQKTDFRDFRNLIIDMVLHTDMSQHFSQLKAMKTAVQQHNGESR